MKKKHIIVNLGIPLESSIRDALHAINRSGLGFCLIIDDGKLKGILTDGDIRRALLNNSNLDDSAKSIMRYDFISLPPNTSIEIIQRALSNYKVIPIVNDLGEIVDLATQESYHHIPLVQPKLDGNELEYVTNCIKSGWISSQGKYVTRFEKDFGKFIGSDKTLSVSNGTVALHLGLVALGITKGDEVIVPDLTFAASINAVLHSGATPVIVDVDPFTMTINAQSVSEAITCRTKAIMPVHLYGYPVEMTDILKLAKKYNLYVIEDCAEALGTMYSGSYVGTLGDIATFSFFGNKTITTGEGGMLVFRSSKILKKAKLLRDHGMSPQRKYWHLEVGYNYRLTNLQAAVGVAQLERLDTFIARKRWIASEYSYHLSGIKSLHLPQDPKGDGSFNSFWLYTILLPEDRMCDRDKIITSLNNDGIEARPVFTPLHQMPIYEKYSTSNFPNASSAASNRGISLPSSVTITREEIITICNSLRLLLQD